MSLLRAAKYLELLIIAVWLGGCAFGARHVNLTYGPAMPSVALAPPRYGRVAVARLTDARSRQEGTGSLLGKVRNGYGMPTASVLANQDPVLWVTEGLARSLIAQGFTVERVNIPDNATDIPTVTGQVTRASGRMYASMDAHITAALAIEHRGTTVAKLMCSGTASKVAWTVSAEEYRSVFEAAMTDFANTCGARLAHALTGGGGGDQ